MAVEVFSSVVPAQDPSCHQLQSEILQVLSPETGIGQSEKVGNGVCPSITGVAFMYLFRY